MMICIVMSMPLYDKYDTYKWNWNQSSSMRLSQHQLPFKCFEISDWDYTRFYNSDGAGLRVRMQCLTRMLIILLERENSTFFNPHHQSSKSGYRVRYFRHVTFKKLSFKYHKMIMANTCNWLKINFSVLLLLTKPYNPKWLIEWQRRNNDPRGPWRSHESHC